MGTATVVARDERREARLEAQRVKHNMRVDEARRIAEQREQRARVTRERQDRRERMRILHLQVLEQAERERRERWADREIRVHQRRMQQLCERTPADMAAADAARHMAAWQRARARALRRRVHEGIRNTDTGLSSSNLGSARANLLVRRARYLYGRADLIHLCARLGLAAPPS